MRKKIGVSAFIIFIVITAFGYLTVWNKSDWEITWCDDLVFDAYGMEIKVLDGTELQENGADYVNYWVMAANGIYYVRNAQLETACEILENLMRTFYRYGKFPREEYQEYEYGWVSCMDAPTVAVLAEMIYEMTEDTKYSQYVDDLSQYMLLSVSNGGYILDFDDKQWLLEYCDENTNVESAEFVLNGSLVGTLGTYLVAKSTNNRELYDLVKLQIKLYKEKIANFWYNGDAWCYYQMGGAKNVDSAHYVIFEIRLFNALYEVTDDTFFRDEANRRINMLKKYYLMYVDDEDVFYFIRAGAPHYYYIDIYSTKLTFYDKDNVVIKEVTMQGRTQGDSLVSGNLPKETEKVEWTVVTDYYDVQMGELTIRRDAAYSLEVITNQFYIEGNKITQNRGLTYVNGSEASRIDISGDLIDVLDYNAIYGIELESLEALKEYNLGIVLYDSAGTSISRYLPALVEGKNLAVFSLTGFRENFATDLVDIKEFTLRIYLEELESMDIKIGNLYKFDNPFELYKYLQESQYKINFGN